MLFGTVELLEEELKIETLNKQRFESLRRALEKTIGRSLPLGRRTAQLMTGKNKPTLTQSGEHPVLLEYEQTRSLQREVFDTAVGELCRDEILRAATDLHMLAPNQTVVFDRPDDTDLLMEYALFEVRRHGKPIIHHFFKKNPPGNPETELVYRSVENSFLLLCQFVEVGNDGVLVKDLLDPKRNNLLLMDEGLITTGIPGLTLFIRALPYPRFIMTSGWGFVLPADLDLEATKRKHQLLMAKTKPRLRNRESIMFFRALGQELRMTEAL